MPTTSDLGEQWWFVYTDGLYFSPDGGEHLTKVMDESAWIATH